MASDKQLKEIKQLRANGHSHQEIADKIGMSRSAVAYQLKKLKDSSDPNNNIHVIIAQDFEPKTTTVSFDPRIFEQHRVSDTLYGTGQDLYEMRGDIIHKTTLPQGIKARDYPEIADLIESDPNWYSLPDGKRLISEFIRNGIRKFESGLGRALSQPSHHSMSYEEQERKKMLRKIYPAVSKYWKDVVDNKAKKLLIGIPPVNEPNKLLRYVANLPKSTESIMKTANKELDEIFRGAGAQEIKDYNNIVIHPIIISYLNSENITESAEIRLCISNGINNLQDLQNFKKSGVDNMEQLEMLKLVNFPDQESYLRAQEWAKIISSTRDTYGNLHGNIAPPHLSENVTKQWYNLRYGSFSDIRLKNPSYIKLDRMERLEGIGWTKDSLKKAIELGFNEDDFDKFTKVSKDFKKMKLPLNKENLDWAKSRNWKIEPYFGFPSPKAASIYGIIEKSPTTHLRLDSLLKEYQDNSAPGPQISDVVELHGLLMKKPFSDICISNLEGGIVEKSDSIS